MWNNLKRIIKKYTYYANRAWVSLWNHGYSATLKRIWFSTRIDQFKEKTLLPYPSLPHPTPWHRLHLYHQLKVEIGTGHGENITHLAANNYDDLFVGFEWAGRFARKSAQAIDKAGLTNAKIIRTDAYDALSKLFRNNSLAQINILFPDPWHKKRHHKRRPITVDFFQTAFAKLVPKGRVFIATDWQEYCQFILDQLAECADWLQWQYGDDYTPAKFSMAPTHYYQKWQKKGRTFYWLDVSRR